MDCPKYTVVLEEWIPAWPRDPASVRTQVAWTNDYDIADACAVGIVTDKLAHSRMPHKWDKREPQEWHGAAYVYEDLAPDAEDYEERDALMGVDASDVTDLAQPGLWFP